MNIILLPAANNTCSATFVTPNDPNFVTLDDPNVVQHLNHVLKVGVGDTVKVGDVEGNVEKVGFRSTRIRTYDQSFVTMPNKKMIENAVDNLTKRRLRRVRMIIGLSFSTSAAQLRKIISDIQTLLQKRNLDENMVVALEGFGESSINLLVIYYTPFDPVENFFQLRSDINFEIMDVVAANGASFAFPVREIKMETPISNTAIKQE